MIEFIVGFITGVFVSALTLYGWLAWQAALIERESCGEEYHEENKVKKS